MGDSTSSQLSARILYGRRVVADLHERLGQTHDRAAVPKLVKLPGVLRPEPELDNVVRPIVGIIGGGVAGLYAAMMLKDAGIPYIILEAQSKDRLGGRLFTHHFPNGGPYDYYDVGAMRFPDTPWMARTFELFKKLDVPLLEYKMKAGYTFLNFNDKVFQRNAEADDPHPKDDVFGVNSFVPSSDILPNYSEPITRTLQPFRDIYVKEGFNALWERLMKYDHLSMRGYLIEVMGFPAELVNWLETYNTSSNSYDRAFTEAVLDSLAFSYPGLDPNKNFWRCNMIKYLEKPVPGKPPLLMEFEKRVISISRDAKGLMVLETDTGPVPYHFDHVISTIPLPALSVVDLRGCQLAWPIKAAFRQLSYGPSTKIGIRFKENWWWKLFKIDGGQTLADVPIRRVVYPSYGPTEPRSRALIVSYAWTQDAERLGALMGNNPKDKALLRSIVVRDLERVHGLNRGSLDPYIDHSDDSIHPYNWYADSHSMGAFAFFGPGDFKTIYPWVTQVACDGRLHFAGEATSSEHAWVVGALNSAHRAVSEILYQHGDEDETRQNIKKFQEQWGENVEFPGDDLTRHVYLGLQASKLGAQV